ncbi:MAG: tRNA epoxyqueuosine(34) reductase QueG [Anaerolineales bacterium]|nr:tRNA epoxyqueuosine(34) reductase QueG [Anaerolineales bacterium]
MIKNKEVFISIKQEIKAEAHRLGFILAGVTTPEPPPHLAVYQEWLSQGRQADMAYLAREEAVLRRSDPRMILPECRSILALAVRYPAPPAGAQMPPEGRYGRVASYAWGEDYHLVLPEKMKSLAAFIEQLVGHPVPNRCYTDTGPILERELAQRAGLGWIGKNTCLINPDLGSYFFLAEIFLGLELEPDSPFEADRCGSCRRCLEACPTGCILPDRTLDARRCISYLTIENKGSIPEDLRPLLGDRVFGCDACQLACPWNRFAEGEIAAEFPGLPGVPTPDLAEALSLTPEAFDLRFQDSPVRRSKRQGYLRNASVALGNSESPGAAPALERAAADPDPLIREHALWALQRIKKGT